MEDLMKSMQALLEQPAKVEDYRDEEGFLCCGKCRTRKEEPFAVPLVLGGKIMDRHPAMCRCRQEEDAKIKAETARRDHLITVNRLKSVCFTSPAMRSCTLENADLSRMEHADLVRFYVENWEEMRRMNTGYLLYGGVGNGKTYTAAAIANALMEKEVSVLMRNMGYFLNAGFADKEEILRDIQRYSLLILDDLGMERGTEYGLEMVFSVINARYESGKPTIITTNLSLNTLRNPQDLAHQRIYDRVLEMCVPVQFHGKSLRGDLARDKFRTLERSMEGAANE